MATSRCAYQYIYIYDVYLYQDSFFHFASSILHHGSLYVLV